MNKIKIQLDNGQEIEAPTEAWVFAILQAFEPAKLGEIVERARRYADGPKLLLPQGNGTPAVHFMIPNAE